MDKILRPDAKGRICLGSTLTKNISGYKVTLDEETQEIILTPYTESPLYEKWLFENKEALESVKRGLQQSAQGDTTYKGSFANHAEEKH